MSEVANENRTHIYRIRRKSDGLFLISAPSKQDPFLWDHVSSMWGPTGAFWRKPETIRSHLLGLCQRRFYVCETLQKSYDLRKRRRRGQRQIEAKSDNPFWLICPVGTPIKHLPPRYEWLNKYEVVATEITVHGNQVMEAREFASFLEDLKMSKETK